MLPKQTEQTIIWEIFCVPWNLLSSLDYLNWLCLKLNNIFRFSYFSNAETTSTHARTLRPSETGRPKMHSRGNIDYRRLFYFVIKLLRIEHVIIVVSQCTINGMFRRVTAATRVKSRQSSSSANEHEIERKTQQQQHSNEKTQTAPFNT